MWPWWASRSGITFVAKTEANVTGVSIVCNVPPGVLNGDILILAWGGNNTSGAVVASHASWTSEQTQGSGVSATGTGFLSRVASGEPASYTFTIGPGISNVGVCMLAFRRSTGVDVKAGADNGNTNSLPAPSVTTTKGNTILICAYAMNGQSGVWTAPASMVERSRYEGGGGFAGFLCCTEEIVAIGATGTRTATNTVTSNSCSVSLAIKP